MCVAVQGESVCDAFLRFGKLVAVSSSLASDTFYLSCPLVTPVTPVLDLSWGSVWFFPSLIYTACSPSLCSSLGIFY